ncbi:TlpA family protein disulfide reductase [Hymenobacter aranciens]
MTQAQPAPAGQHSARPSAGVLIAALTELGGHAQEYGHRADGCHRRLQHHYLDFWANWCKPCQAGQPVLLALRRQFAGRPEVVFVGISIDTNLAPWRRRRRLMRRWPCSGSLLASPATPR